MYKKVFLYYSIIIHYESKCEVICTVCPNILQLPETCNVLMQRDIEKSFTYRTLPRAQLTRL